MIPFDRQCDVCGETYTARGNRARFCANCIAERRRMWHRRHYLLHRKAVIERTTMYSLNHREQAYRSAREWEKRNSLKVNANMRRKRQQATAQKQLIKLVEAQTHA